MVIVPPICPHCYSPGATKNGMSAAGRQVMRCRSVACGRLFVVSPSRPRISQDAKAIAMVMAPMIGKPITAAIIAQATGLCERTIYAYRAKKGGAGV